MQLGRFIAKSRIIDLESRALEGAFNELLSVCPLKGNINRPQSKLLDDLIDREHNMTTYLGNGIAMPHTKVTMKRPYILAVGRTPEGLEYDGLPDYNEVRLVFLLLASNKEPNYLTVLALLAQIFQETVFANELVAIPETDQFKIKILQAFGARRNTPKRLGERGNRFMLKQGDRIARNTKCNKIIIFGDTFREEYIPDKSFSELDVLLVANGGISIGAREFYQETIPVRSFSTSRLSQLRSAVLIGLTRGIIDFKDKLCCICGIPKSDKIDTLVVVDVEKEFHSVLTQEAKLLPPGVRPEILERVFGIATELSIEGREGRPIGCLFVVGDSEKIKEYTKPLVLNPFHGYGDEDRNILNPFMDETVKELSSIDGAFIIRGDGVLDSAGTLIHAPDSEHQLPGGLGSRHAAGAAISKVVNCISIVVSSSTGQVTVFRNGKMLSLIEKVNQREI